MAEFDQPTSFDAAGILRQSRARYAALKSYRDSGEDSCRLSDLAEFLPPRVRAILRSASLEQPQVVRFRSWFRRPADLRFEWVSHHPYPPLRHIESFFVIWNGASGAHFHSPWETRAVDSARTAVACATGISSGTAFNFAAFFLPDIGIGSPLGFLPSPGVAEETVEDVACWKIRTLHPRRSAENMAAQLRDLLGEGTPAKKIPEEVAERERSVTVFIAKHDLLVRRIQEGCSVETRRDIHVDEVLPDDLFRESPDACKPHGE